MTRALAAALVALVAAPHVAAADSAHLVTAVPDRKAKVTELVLVGESGQLYVPREDGWAREHAGGVAADVAGAVRGKDGTVYVVAGSAPVYEHVDGTWRVRSIGVRRWSHASTLTGVPIMSAGRNLFTLDGDRWRRIGTARGRVERLWASSRKRIYVVDDTGEIARGDGRRWTEIAGVFKDPERAERLVGAPGKALYAIGDAGTIANIGTSKAKPVRIPDELSGLDVTAAGTGHKGAIYVAGTVGDRYVLASLRKNELSLVDELPALEEGDRYSLIVGDRHGSLLVGSYDGVVHIRDKDGAFQQRAVSTALPEESPVAVRGERRPARTR